ncbi:hypothetical protein EES37_38310 [Streptomyces sp. ADI91-18]|nr:hypothetical protein EES37_38310 [Streptomyces sp. ADI91-18]
MPSHPAIRALSDVLTPCRQSSEGAPHDLAGTAEAEHRLGIRLPSDYIAFIETYGAGGIDGDALWISPPYREAGGDSVVDMAALFWEQAPESYSRWLPPEVSADRLLRWGFVEDGTHLFWLMTGEDSDTWPIADLYEDGGPFTIHKEGFAAYAQRWCAPTPGPTTEPIQFIHWREYGHLMEQGLNPAS